jgi:hypothetical protein
VGSQKLQLFFQFALPRFLPPLPLARVLRPPCTRLSLFLHQFTKTIEFGFGQYLIKQQLFYFTVIVGTGLSDGRLLVLVCRGDGGGSGRWAVAMRTREPITALYRSSTRAGDPAHRWSGVLHTAVVHRRGVVVRLIHLRSKPVVTTATATTTTTVREYQRRNSH